MFRIYSILLFFIGIFTTTAQIGSARIYTSLHFEGGYGINVTNQNVNLSLTDINDFVNGVSTSNLKNHIQVTSRGGYEIWVKSQQAEFMSANQLTTLPVEIIKIDAVNSYGSGSVYLNNQSSLLISNPTKLLGENIDVTYSVPANKTNLLFNQQETSFETVVTYTLILK